MIARIRKKNSYKLLPFTKALNNVDSWLSMYERDVVQGLWSFFHVAVKVNTVLSCQKNATTTASDYSIAYDECNAIRNERSGRIQVVVVCVCVCECAGMHILVGIAKQPRCAHPDDPVASKAFGLPHKGYRLMWMVCLNRNKHTHTHTLKADGFTPCF